MDIFATKGSRRYVYEVKTGRQVVSSRDILTLIKKARVMKARPALALGRETRISKKAMRLCRDYRVRISRIKR